MENSYKYFKNKDCKYYPCHKLDGDFNCMFCFCPMYTLEKCPGDPEYIQSDGRTVKSCMDCIFPHQPDNYDKIMKILANKDI